MNEKMYNILCRKILLPLSDAATRQSVMRYYEFYNRAQWWHRERLTEYQDKKLVETVRIAYNETNFYRDLFNKHGLSPDDIKNSEDLHKLPVVTKDMLRKAYPNKCTRKTGYRWQESYTSGSTGAPFVVRVDSLSMSIARALMIFRATFSGWDIGESMMQTGMTLKRGIIKRIKDHLLRVSYVSAFDLSDGMLDKYLEIIDKKKHKYIMGYASSLYCLAKRAEEIGFNSPISGVVSWGDNMFEHYRKRIERQFGIKVTDTYGCGEGIQVAAQCGYNDGEYHIFMPHVIVEFIENGLPVTKNELGEIVLTRLDAGSMPLIRYKIGDVGRGSSKETCLCGRGLKMMKNIEGRNSDIIRTPNGNKLIVHFFTGIFEYITSIDSFQVVQEKVDEIIIKIVPMHDFSLKDWNYIKDEIHAKGDRDLQIKLEIVKDIPIENSNKRRFVISKI